MLDSRCLFSLMKKSYTKNLFVIFIAFICSGCGSLETLPPGREFDLKHNERYEKTYCKKIPRIYSGVSLDVCMFFIGPPFPEDKEYDGPGLYSYLTDIIFSFAVDTLALPYTTFRQFRDGSLRLKRKDSN